MVYHITDECIACGQCQSECPSECISEGDVYSIDASECIGCGNCADVCPTGACVPME